MGIEKDFDPAGLAIITKSGSTLSNLSYRLRYGPHEVLYVLIMNPCVILFREAG